MLSSVFKRLLTVSATQLKQRTRTFLSKSYCCEETWVKRLQAPVFKKIDYDDLYQQLDRSFNLDLRISSLDVDLFVSGIEGESYQNEIEDVIYRLRQNPESVLLRDRTMHAFIRFFIKIGKKKELLHILNNRIYYGIFPDYYLSNILMDLFLKENDPMSAAKVAVLQMLQEDFDHPILRPLSVYSCYKYLSSPDIWEPPKAPEVDPDEEEVKVRVKTLKKPYFDDHFDIVDTNHLIGKALYLAGNGLAGPLGASSQLVGLALYEKRTVARDFLTDVLAKKIPIHGDAVHKAIEFTKQRPKVAEGAVPPEETDAIKSEKGELLTALEKAKESDLLGGDLEAIAAAEVTKSVQENEEKDIADLTNLLKKWEQEREDHIQEEIFESKKRKAIEEIKATREKLSEEEKKVFYFDKEDEWELIVEEKEKEIEQAEEIARTSKKKTSEEVYIPPVIKKKYNQR